MGYFNFYKQNQEALIYDGMIKEICGNFGLPCKYMIKNRIKDNWLLGDSLISQFDDSTSFEVNLYTDNVSDFNGTDEFFSKFGLQMNNEIVLYGSLTELNKLTGSIPYPGDLIYIPTMNRIFELRKAEDKNSFFLMGENLSYKLSCKLFEYNQEILTTNIPGVDVHNGKTTISQELIDNDIESLFIVNTISSSITVGATVFDGINISTITDIVDIGTTETGIFITGTISSNSLFIGGYVTATLHDTKLASPNVIDIIDFSNISNISGF